MGGVARAAARRGRRADVRTLSYAALPAACVVATRLALSLAAGAGAANARVRGLWGGRRRRAAPNDGAAHSPHGAQVLVPLMRIGPLVAPQRLCAPPRGGCHRPRARPRGRRGACACGVDGACVVLVRGPACHHECGRRERMLSMTATSRVNANALCLWQRSSRCCPRAWTKRRWHMWCLRAARRALRRACCASAATWPPTGPHGAKPKGSFPVTSCWRRRHQPSTLSRRTWSPRSAAALHSPSHLDRKSRRPARRVRGGRRDARHDDSGCVGGGGGRSGRYSARASQLAPPTRVLSIGGEAMPRTMLKRGFRDVGDGWARR